MGKNMNDVIAKLNCKQVLIIFSLGLCLLLFGPNFSGLDGGWVAPGFVQAQTGGSQGTGTTDENTDDTPSASDIADFQDKYDKDRDGEVDAPEEEPDEPAAEPDQDTEDEADEQDDDDLGDDDKDNLGDVDDGEVRDDEGRADAAHTGKNRDDIDGEESPDYRLSGYDRYPVENDLRRLGSRSELTPLIEREEKLLLEN